jgi:hypothetical protein
MKLILSETSIITPIGINISNIAANVAKYRFKMYRSIIVNISKGLKIQGLKFIVC